MSTFARGHNLRSKGLSGNHTLNVDRATGEAQDTTTVAIRFEFPNPQDLRGIPAIGRGVAGAMNHTSPHLEIEHA